MTPRVCSDGLFSALFLPLLALVFGACATPQIVERPENDTPLAQPVPTLHYVLADPTQSGKQWKEISPSSPSSGRRYQNLFTGSTWSFEARCQKSEPQSATAPLQTPSLSEVAQSLHRPLVFVTPAQSQPVPFLSSHAWETQGQIQPTDQKTPLRLHSVIYLSGNCVFQFQSLSLREHSSQDSAAFRKWTDTFQVLVPET
jgi:hypothetical protein